MEMNNKEYLNTIKSLRGTANYHVVRALLHELRRERQFRKRIEILRIDQSQRLLLAVIERDKLLYE
jgi:hypothetical protein